MVPTAGTVALLYRKGGSQSPDRWLKRSRNTHSWFSDYAKFLGSESGYLFVSEVDALKGKRGVLTREEYTHFLLGKDSENVKCIEFVSLQDMKGSIYFGGQYDKLGEVANMEWDKVVAAIAQHEKTITLSVGQLTTGITIPEWTAVLMLSNMRSPALYNGLAFMMMFGSSMTVFAGKEYFLNYSDYGKLGGLEVGQTLEGGDIIKISSGNLIVKIDDHEQTPYWDMAGAGCPYVTLPEGYQYRVDEYTARREVPYPDSYSVILSTVPATPSGSTGNTSTESSGNTSNESTGNASTESGSDDTGNEYWKSHVHTFSWVTTQEATAEQDGIQENRCSC